MALDSYLERFWARVRRGTDDECWPWLTGRVPQGYGIFAPSRKHRWYAHRYSYELHYGPIPAGLKVCHRCDNPPCVNPRHLFAGTQRDNMQDCKQKGRQNVPDRGGTSNGRAKITEDDVRAIRARAAVSDKRGTIAAIARDYDLTWTAVKYIVNGRNWSHVD